MTMDDRAEKVILVDEQDRQIGLADKLQAHEEGLLHRAFSVIVFNEHGDILLQQRALHKYHSAGLWTNACCSHPRDGEAVIDAAHRRLSEEMGFDCDLTPIDVLHYTTPPLDTGLIENEMLHLLAGLWTSQDIAFDPSEVNAVRWVSPDELKKAVDDAPESYSYWFKLYLQRFDMGEIFSRLS